MNRKIILVLSQCATALSSGVVPAPKHAMRRRAPGFLPGGKFDLESRDLRHDASEVAGYFDRLEDDPRMYITDHIGELEDLGYRFGSPTPLRASRRR